jgi:hypothetical protein
VFKKKLRDYSIRGKYQILKCRGGGGGGGVNVVSKKGQRSTREDTDYVYKNKKGSSVHVAPACTGSREMSDHFGSYVHSLPQHFSKRFPGLEPITSWSQGNSFTAALGLPFRLCILE